MDKQKKDQLPRNTETALSEPARHTPRPVITVDYDLYAHYLEDTDLSEEEKREFLQMLWNIICEFVSLGFGVHPVQQAQKDCGKPEEKLPSIEPEPPESVEYNESPLVKEFRNAINLRVEKREGVES